MTLKEALQSAKDGNFVTNEHFDRNQSLHYYNGQFYYEDGAVVTPDFLYAQDFAVNGAWKISIRKENVNRNKLHDMHENNKGYTLQSGSYHECYLDSKGENEHEENNNRKI